MAKVMPIFNIMDFEMQNEIIRHCQSDNKLDLHLDSTRLCDAIDRVLPMNEMQRLIVEKVFYNLRNIPNFNCDRIEDQLLLNICGEGGVGSSRVVHAIELGYILLSRDSDLVIIAPIGAAADNIGGSTIYTSLAIGVRNRNGKSNTISNLWTARCIMIMDEISMVELEMLSNMGK